MRNKKYAPYCVICRSRNYQAGFGIDIENHAHVCMDCAINISSIAMNFIAEHTELYHDNGCYADVVAKDATYDDGE